MREHRVKNPELSANSADKLTECAEYIRKHLGVLPPLAIVLGSGFHQVSSILENCRELPYGQIPGFPRTSVAGHCGNLLLGEVAGNPIIIAAGRAHYYEGYEMAEVVFPVRALANCGVRDLVVTNAAGGINRRFRPGDFMLVTDHINGLGVNPLRGVGRTGGPDSPAFVDLSCAYSPRLRKLMEKAAASEKIHLRKGVYISVPGPSYETPAEIRAFRKWGADAVGMSLVPEVLMGRFMGVEVAGVSCITNLAAGMRPEALSHQEVLKAGEEQGTKAARLLAEFTREYYGSKSATKHKQKNLRLGDKPLISQL